MVVNHETETAHVVRVAGKELGSAMVGDSEELPVLGGEDFAYFTQASMRTCAHARRAHALLAAPPSLPHPRRRALE